MNKKTDTSPHFSTPFLGQDSNGIEQGLLDLFHTEEPRDNTTVLDLSEVKVSKDDDARFRNYTDTCYTEDVERHGLKATWGKICKWLTNNRSFAPECLSIENFGELYEIGLAIEDKSKKKESGQYFTPPDVAMVMSKWLDGLKGENVCDVACGTGNLVLAYLESIGCDRALALLMSKRIFLYDSDPVALRICLTAISLRYGDEAAENTIVQCGDFLDRTISLPDNCKVISNPPYSQIKLKSPEWSDTEVIRSSGELYAAFMEKILRSNARMVIITPYSFLGGKGFYPLRRILNAHNGFIVAFDNIPGNIFLGRKHGIFNTNKGNSVRAAITVSEDKPDSEFGFRVSPLIRFRREEREALLNCETLEKMLPDEHQLVDKHNPMFAKCDKRLTEIFDAWRLASDKTVASFVSETGQHHLFVPNTCRYFTAASDHGLNRSGQIELSFENESVFDFVYCLVNSSFAYWFWRLYDGGITYPRGLLLKMPLFFGRLSKDDIAFFHDTAREMISREGDFLVTKNNVGVQENVKFPRSFRDSINRRALGILNVPADPSIFDIVHSNAALEVNA